MFSRNFVIQIVAVGVMVVFLALAAGVSTPIAAEAGRSQLTYSDQVNDGDPPEVALGIAMGAFRGLFVNYLWIRANRLKEEGKFYEAIELSSAITRLQPRFPRVWTFHAWNMAYNISVATNTAFERWQWVNAGVNLLRSEAIPRNPNEVHLYRELAWIFIHKIQGYADDANHYYKREVAREWTIALGEPPRLDGTREQNRQRMIDFLTAIAEAPASLDEVIARELADQETRRDPLPPGGVRESKVRLLAARIKDDAKLSFDFNLLRFVEMRRAWINAWYVQEQEYKQELKDTERNQVIDELMADPQFEDAWPRLLNWVRRTVLIDKYNMIPSRMIQYTREVGPLDWRHPASHALYWARLGVDEGLERRGVSQFDTLNTDRIVLHAIQELYRYGQINYDLLTNEYFVLTNFDWVDPYGELLDTMIDRGGIATSRERTYTLYGAGYENFLKDVIRVYYNRGDIANAERYHERLRTWPGININDSSLIERLKLPLAEFVELELKDRLTTPYVAVQEIDAALTDAFLRGLGEGKPEIFKRQMEYAARVRGIYLTLQGVRTLADPETERMKAFVGETFADAAAAVLLRLLSGGSFGYYRLGPQQAALLYRRTPTQIQRIVYDDLASAVQRTQGMPEEGFKALFPEPPGMAEYRESLAKLDSESDRARQRQIEFEKDPNRKVQ